MDNFTSIYSKGTHIDGLKNWPSLSPLGTQSDPIWLLCSSTESNINKFSTMQKHMKRLWVSLFSSFSHSLHLPTLFTSKDLVFGDWKLFFFHQDFQRDREFEAMSLGVEDKSMEMRFRLRWWKAIKWWGLGLVEWGRWMQLFIEIMFIPHLVWNTFPWGKA